MKLSFAACLTALVTFNASNAIAYDPGAYGPGVHDVKVFDNVETGQVVIFVFYFPGKVSEAELLRRFGPICADSGTPVGGNTEGPKTIILEDGSEAVVKIKNISCAK